MGFDAEIVVYSDLDFVIKKEVVEILWKGNNFPDTKAVIFRAAGGDDFYIPQRDFLAEHFEQSGAKVMNARTYKRWSRLDKITQHFELQRAKLPFIDSKVYDLNERLISEEKDFPKILKKNLSSRGKDVYKIENLSEYQNLFNEGYWSRTMLLQPFLKSGQDLRIIVVGGKVIGAMKRIAQEGKYLTNYSQGGMVESYDIFADKKALEIAERTAKHFLLDYVGVDLMAGEAGDWKVLEVNRACQFKGFEESTKINVPQKVLEYLGLLAK